MKAKEGRKERERERERERGKILLITFLFRVMSSKWKHTAENGKKIT